jgi:hypothetical protein
MQPSLPPTSDAPSQSCAPPFRAWREDLDHREYEYLLTPEAAPRVDPVRRFGISTDDAAMLGEIDKAFRD